MKPLPKHPKQQRMEDMTFPMLKPSSKTKEMHRWDKVLKESEQGLENQRCKSCGVYPGSSHTDRCEVLSEIRKLAWKEYKKSDKVIWEGREWLQSISDPHHERHVAVVVLLVVAIIYCVAVLL